jgi:cobalamin biosynthesis protein CbiD
VADVAGGRAGFHHRDAAQKRLIGHFAKPLRLSRDLADQVHAAGIAMPAIEDIGHVDIDDVAVAQRFRIGNAVADDMVDRRADRLAIAAIVERRREGAMVHAEFKRQLVE